MPSITKTSSRRSTRTDKPRRPKMTAEDATKFDATSERSAVQVMEAIDARREEGKHVGCTCEPYEEVLTFNRWKALGRSVIKGETSLRINSFVPVEGKDGEDSDKKKEGESSYLIPKILILFCRCQTREIEAKVMAN